MFTVPNAVDATTYPQQARLDSRDFDVITAGYGATAVESGCAVTAQGTPNLTVAVAAGVVRIGGRRAVVAGGNSASVATADATNPRIDLVTIDTAGAIQLVTGTAGATPVVPSIPASRVVIARIDVPATATTVTTGQLVDKRIIVDVPRSENVRWYGVKGDGRTVADGAMTSGAATLTSATANFTSADVGKLVIVANATSTAFRLATQIATVGSTTSITLAAKAKASQTAQTWKIDNGRNGTDAVTTNDSATVTSATGAFAAVDVGRQITVTGAGRKALITTIASVTNSTTVVLAVAATRTCTAENVIIGTDDTTALSACLATGNTVWEFPVGTYLAQTSLAGASPSLQIATGVTLRGAGWGTVLQSVETGTATTTEFMGTNFYNTGSSDPTTNINNIVIENMHIRGTAVESGFLENVPNLLSLNAASDVLVRNVKFTNFRSDAIYLGSGSAGNVERHNERIRIEHCHFDGINNDNRNAISVIDGSDVSILACYFANVANDAMPGAIDVEPNAASGAYPRIRGIRIEDCYFTRVGGNVGVIAWAIQVADSVLTYAAQGLVVANNVAYDCFNSTAFFFANQGGTATAASRPANILVAANVVANQSGSLGRGTNYITELENIIGAKFVNNVFSDTYSSFLVGYSTTCFSIEVVNNTFRNCSYGVTRTIEAVRVTDLTVEDNYFYHCPGTIMGLYIGSGSTGSSDGISFTSNVIRQGGSNVTTAIAVKHASHTTVQNDLSYYQNTIPNNAALAIAPFVNQGISYTVSASATTVDASLVPPNGTVTLTTSATGTAGTLTVSNGVVGQIMTFEWVVPTVNQTYATASNMKFAGAAAWTHTLTAGRRDIATFRFDGTNWNELSRSINVG